MESRIYPCTIIIFLIECEIFHKYEKKYPRENNTKSAGFFEESPLKYKSKKGGENAL